MTKIKLARKANEADKLVGSQMMRTTAKATYSQVFCAG